MQIYISEEAIIADIQEKFHQIYPKLKLEFFRDPVGEGEHIHKNIRVSPDTPIEKIRIRHHFGWLDVSHYRTALAVEHDLSHLFGLHAKILHKSGSLWLQATGTGHLSLEELSAGDTPKKSTFHLPEEPEAE